MSWHFLERWLERANQHSTLIGKFWITYLIVCRMVIIGSIGDRVYADEQSEFRCNTQQPGCVQICYNKFAPISHVRFWGFQLMCVTMPSVGFIVYSGHKAKEKMRVEQSKKQEAKAQLMAEKKSERAVSGSASVLPNAIAATGGNGRLVVREIGTQTHRNVDDDSDSSGKNYSRRGRHQSERTGHHHRRSPRHKEKEEDAWGKETVTGSIPNIPPAGMPITVKPSEIPPADTMPGGFQAMIDNHGKSLKDVSKEESKKKCGIMVGKSVSQHFHLYMANVFFRLASEATFGILQLWLFGYKVNEMFKCEGFPCPHVVDCFISRPAEKTIFLNFMLGFTIFCVILNLMEFKYLCYLFFKARVKLTSTARAPPMLPKPLAYPSGPCPAYEPLGFDIPEPRTLPVSPKRDRSYNNLPPPPPPTLNNSMQIGPPILPANGAFDVDMVAQQFGPSATALLNTNGSLYHEQENNRKKWMLPKKK